MDELLKALGAVCLSILVIALLIIIVVYVRNLITRIKKRIRVVYCQDCSHLKYKNCCDLLDRWMADNDFCSRGEGK